MSGQGSSRRRHPSRRGPWPDIPSELLGLVLLRLHSHADRVRLRAVCRAWRSGARLQYPLPPLLPWLALPDGRFLSLPDGAVHHLPVPRDVCSRVSTGGALFLVHRDGRCSLTSSSRASGTIRPAAFPFRRNTIDRHRADNIVRKAVVSDRLVAVVKSTGRNNVIVSTTSRGGRRAPTMEWTPPVGSFTVDIALFKGKLYVLTADLGKQERELHVLDVGDGRITSVCCVPSVPKDDHDHYYEDQRDEPNDDDEGGSDSDEGGSSDDDLFVQRDYLVVSGDQLLMVKRMIDSPLTFLTHKQTHWFEVFEAVGLISSGRGRWIEVDSLMGRALFVSQGCSESLPAATRGSGGIGVREDCIYFMNENDKFTNTSMKKIYENPFLDSGVYDMRNDQVTPLMPSWEAMETVVPTAACDGPWSPSWLFPKS